MVAALVDSLASVDWSAPWLLPYRASGQWVAAACETGATVAEALNDECAKGLNDGRVGAMPQLAGGLLRFVAHEELPAACSYEAYIAETAQVPTRNNLHDFFNGLAWLRWPALKRRLNELQAAELQRDGVGPSRGKVRDTSTLFDENAAWLQMPQPLEQALRLRDWRALFVDHRASWADVTVVLFGHALLEKLVAPRKPITAHAWLLPQGLPVAQAERWLCQSLFSCGPQARPFHPLPVLGIPGWWPANELPGFYEDGDVFRPQRDRGVTAIIKS